jgi:hypothetical protein
MLKEKDIQQIIPSVAIFEMDLGSIGKEAEGKRLL